MKGRQRLGPIWKKLRSQPTRPGRLSSQFRYATKPTVPPRLCPVIGVFMIFKAYIAHALVSDGLMSLLLALLAGCAVSLFEEFRGRSRDVKIKIEPMAAKNALDAKF